MTPAELYKLASDRLTGIEPGERLTPLEAALIAYANCMSPTLLNLPRASELAQEALALGATPKQLHDIIVLLSALGTHSLMLGSVMIDALDTGTDKTLDPNRQALWDKYVGDDPYWVQFETLTPGFLSALLRQSPHTFEAFFTFCALPWQDRSLPAKLMELIALSVDAAPSHRFGPGFRLHLENAVSLGIPPAKILGAIELAAASGEHTGVA